MIFGPAPMKSGPTGYFFDIEKELEKQFGAIDLKSPVFDFTFTDYYKPEMGGGLKKIFFSFRNLISPQEIVSVKIATNRLEETYRLPQPVDGISRPINLDPGYLDGSKLVLASTKNYAHRIYLNNGIYAEITFLYSKNQFHPLPWTYPDYQTEPYLIFFQQVRTTCLTQLK